ncbi:MAG: peptidoglycan bridge formation glycyltransferase FemA/FemB family protein [Crocinitomicaceae bacterium]|nr:peptidoglycan bridge formation glycyltransferase FemA/FemB family protein [Crocinitomicaceae bacterium]
MSSITWHTEDILSTELKNQFHFSFDKLFSDVFAKLNNAKFELGQFEFEKTQFYVPCLFREGKLLTSLQLLYVPSREDHPKLDKTLEKAMLDHFVNLLKKEQRVDRILQPMHWSVFQAAPAGSIDAPFGSYQIDLSLNEEEIWKGLHSKHRNVIRNAEKKDAIIIDGPAAISRFYELYKDTMQRNNMFLEPLSYFEDLRDSGISYYCGVVSVSDHDMGAVFIPYTKQGGYYVFGGSEARITLTGAMNYLHYKAILNLREKGVKVYDFVGARLSDVSGTKLDGIQKFKKRFGGELKEGLLWKMDLNKTKCKMYDLALKTKLKLKGSKPLQDIIDQERAKFG